MSPTCEPTQAESAFITCKGLTKSFGGTLALAGVDLTIYSRQIHGLVGQNGAGKSTLLGLLTGRLRPTQGHIEVDGAAFGSRGVGVREAVDRGISAVYQELTLVPALNAVENVFLGRELHRGGVLRTQEMRQRFNEICAELDVRIPADVPVRELSIAHQQFVEIVRGLNAEAKVLLLDEPTAALPERERGIVLSTMRRLRDRGMGIVLVTHALDEVLEVSDTVTVLRGGATVGSGPASQWEKRSLVHAMSGKYQEFLPEHGKATYQDPYVQVRGLMVPGLIEGIDLDVRPGEIVGLAGLVGAGRTTILRCLAGAEPRAVGELRIDGIKKPWPRRVGRSLSHGIAFLPEDRKTQGLHLTRSILDNLTLIDLAAVSDGPVVRVGKQRRALKSLATKVSLPDYPATKPVGELSGGNQQKILLGKALHARPRLLLADEPTRGVDVSAKVDIMTSLRGLANDGMAIVMTSSEIEDVLDIADTVLVVADGRIAATLDTRDRSVSVKDVLNIVFDSVDDLGSVAESPKGQTA